ncbi:MAG TPA: lipid II flippase MurJ, partial [bacterium]|nr:lipid II flippase MurJ [bacterium]
VGLAFVGAQRLGNQALYALKDYRGPAALAAMTLVINVVLSLALLKPLGTGGLALANGLASVFGLAGLMLRLRPRLPGLMLRRTLAASGKALPASALMGLLAWGGALLLGLGAPHSFTRTALALRVLPLVALCVAAYAVAVAAFGHTEARDVWDKFRKKLASGN